MIGHIEEWQGVKTTKADYARNPNRLAEARFPSPHARYAAHRVDTRR